MFKFNSAICLLTFIVIIGYCSGKFLYNAFYEIEIGIFFKLDPNDILLLH